MDIRERLKTGAERFDRRLADRAPTGPGRVGEAAAYSLLAGGKRIRPLLCQLVCEACGGSEDLAFPFAVALEMVHTYSLIHDDLPAMDDDDTRRGRPTCHKVYGEALAILAGDGLLTLAFETLLAGPGPAGRGVAAALELARAAGFAGMVGGQALDMAAERRTPEHGELTEIHALKTGRLLAASSALGAIAAGAPDPEVAAFRDFGADLGLLFQIADDLLDATGTTARLGKTAGSDARRGKATFVTVLGPERARRERDLALARCLDRLAPSSRDTAPLAALARYIAEREH